MIGLMKGRILEAMANESGEWFLVCNTCGASKSIAELGGIRFKAASVGKRTLVRCSKCGRIRVARFERRVGGVLK